MMAECWNHSNFDKSLNYLQIQAIFVDAASVDVFQTLIQCLWSYQFTDCDYCLRLIYTGVFAPMWVHLFFYIKFWFDFLFFKNLSFPYLYDSYTLKYGVMKIAK